MSTVNVLDMYIAGPHDTQSLRPTDCEPDSPIDPDSSLNFPGSGNSGASSQRDSPSSPTSSFPEASARDSPAASGSLSPGTRVGFSLVSDNTSSPAKGAEHGRYLTAKYPKHQTGLIRKRLAVEDWIDEQLRILFDISDDGYETYDTSVDLDELLNLDTDEQRTEYIQQKISHAPKPAAVQQQFTEELLSKARTL